MIEPSDDLPKNLTAIDGAQIEVLTKKELLDRHEGERRAPTITTVRVSRWDSDPPDHFHVSIAQLPAGTEGFEVRPYGMGIDYRYSVTEGSVRMVEEMMEVE